MPGVRPKRLVYKNLAEGSKFTVTLKPQNQQQYHTGVKHVKFGHYK